MTIIEAINRIDALKPNGYGQAEKIKWLSDLDRAVKSEIIDTHEGGGEPFAGYGSDTPLDTVLLIPELYDDVYVKWLEANIDYANGEYGKYNNSIAMFNSEYSGFRRYYNRTHMPLGKSFHFF